VISNIALHWGTLHRTIRTKDAAIAWFGAQQRLAASAFVEVLAGVSRHRFALGEAANRAYQRGFQKKLAESGFAPSRLFWFRHFVWQNLNSVLWYGIKRKG